MALLASLRTYNLLYYRKLPRLLGAGVKEGENTILHDALYCKTKNEKRKSRLAVSAVFFNYFLYNQIFF